MMNIVFFIQIFIMNIVIIPKENIVLTKNIAINIDEIKIYNIKQPKLITKDVTRIIYKQEEGQAEGRTKE